jgi:hypothetical protein
MDKRLDLKFDVTGSVHAPQRMGQARLWQPTVDPEKAAQIRRRLGRGRWGGHPAKFDPADYRKRHAAARGINCLKRNRAVATRYDELAVRDVATVTVAAINEWL